MEFRDNIFENIATVSETTVWVLLGNSALLTNYAIDILKEHEKSKSKLTKSFAAVPTNIMSSTIVDMDTDETEDNSGLSVCTLDEVWKGPGKNIAGRWWCVASYDNMTKKDRTNLFNYLKNPNKHVLLVVTVSDYRNIMELKKNRIFSSSNSCHIVNISFPSSRWLRQIARSLFSEQNVVLTDTQLDTFTIKMNGSYEEYRDTVDKIVLNIKALTNSEFEVPTEVSPEHFKEATKDIEHFEVNDLLRYMLTPIKGNKPLNGRRAVHKALAQLLEKMTAKEICGKLRYRAKEMLAYRAAINSGIIPVKIPYNATKVQEKLPENEMYEKIKKAPAFTFKRNAYLSSQTSIEDWFFIYVMLENVSHKAIEQQYLRTLLSVINRTSISNDRLMNNLNIKNTLDEGLVALNGVMYSNWWQSLEQLEQ